MTATASQTDFKCIQDLLGLKKCKCIIASPDRKNMFYKKLFRSGKDVDTITSILMPIVRNLLQYKSDYPLTIVYVTLRLCRFIYKLFEHVLGNEQYFPTGSAFNSRKQVVRTISRSSNRSDERCNFKAALFRKECCPCRFCYCCHWDGCR